jgi:hypothetical protein
VNEDTVPGATVVLDCPVQTDPRTVVTNGNRFFEFKDVEPGTNYHVTVSAQFANWTSPAVILKPGQYAILTGSKLQIAEGSPQSLWLLRLPPEEMAAEQVKAEEQQRIFGIIPNFYVVYDHDAAPLTTKLNSSSPPKSFSIFFTIVGVAAFAGINQAADNPNYGRRAKGYSERFGAGCGDGAIDIMVGGAILPSLLHQDPRYCYQGTGTNKSRALHALFCRETTDVGSQTTRP